MTRSLKKEIIKLWLSHSSSNNSQDTIKIMIFLFTFQGHPLKMVRLFTLFLDLVANSKHHKKRTVCFVVVWLSTSAFNKQLLFFIFILQTFLIYQSNQSLIKMKVSSFFQNYLCILSHFALALLSFFMHATYSKLWFIEVKKSHILILFYLLHFDDWNVMFGSRNTPTWDK